MIVSVSSLVAAARVSIPDRATLELVDQRVKDPAVDLVEPQRVDLQQLQGTIRGGIGHHGLTCHLGDIAHPAQQPVGNAGCAPRPARRASLRRHRRAPSTGWPRNGE